MARNFFHNAFDRMIKARELQARRYVNGSIMHLDDDKLKMLGRTREEIKREGHQAYYF